MSHTPGPWRVEFDFLGARVVHEEAERCGLSIVVDNVRIWKTEPGGDPEALANTHLVAAAPELLEALRKLVAVAEIPPPLAIADLEEARAAIAKAEGRS